MNMNQFNTVTSNNFTHRFFAKKPAIERCIVDGGAKTKSYKQYLEIEIARRRNGRVDRPGLDDNNAKSLKHGNEAFLDYMLDSVFVGSK